MYREAIVYASVLALVAGVAFSPTNGRIQDSLAKSRDGSYDAPAEIIDRVKGGYTLKLEGGETITANGYIDPLEAANTKGVATIRKDAGQTYIDRWRPVKEYKVINSPVADILLNERSGQLYAEFEDKTQYPIDRQLWFEPKAVIGKRAVVNDGYVTAFN